MVDRLGLVLESIDFLIKLVNKRTLQLNQYQCQHLAECLEQFRDYLTSLPHFCNYGVCSTLLKQIGWIMKKAITLVEDCNNEDWLSKALFHAVSNEGINEIVADLKWCLDTKYKHAQATSTDAIYPGSSFEIVKSPPQLVPAPNEAVHKDIDCLLVKLQNFVLKTENEEKKCLAIYLHKRIETLINGKSMSDTLILDQLFWELRASEPKACLEHLGQGAAGTVYKTSWLGVPCAQKIFKGGLGENLKKEVGILTKLNHPHIVKLFCCFNNEDRDSILLELMDGSLYDLIKKQRGNTKNGLSSPEVIVDILLQVAKGMSYLHENGVAHRDLKSTNILVMETGGLQASCEESEYSLIVKLADFELVKLFDPTRSSFVTMSKRNVGTTVWRAPEVIDGDDSKMPKIKLKKADIYSFAMVAYELVTGNVPFEDWKPSREELYREIRKGRRPKLPQSCPPTLVALIQDCWHQDPQLRPSFPSICPRLLEMKSFFVLGFDAFTTGLKSEQYYQSRFASVIGRTIASCTGLQIFFHILMKILALIGITLHQDIAVAPQMILGAVALEDNGRAEEAKAPETEVINESPKHIDSHPLDVEHSDFGSTLQSTVGFMEHLNTTEDQYIDTVYVLKTIEDTKEITSDVTEKDPQVLVDSDQEIAWDDLRVNIYIRRLWSIGGREIPT